MPYISNFIINIALAIPQNFRDGTALSMLVIVYW